MLSLLTAALLAAAPMDHGTDHDHGGDRHHAEAHAGAMDTVIGDVRTVDAEARTALIRHEALETMEMPSMVMEFVIAEDVDIALFEPGAALSITVMRMNGVLTVIAAEPAGD